MEILDIKELQLDHTVVLIQEGHSGKLKLWSV